MTTRNAGTPVGAAATTRNAGTAAAAGVTTRRAATIVLSVLAIIGLIGMIAIWQLGNSGRFAWSGREPGEAALTAFALLQLSFSVGLPAFATLAAGSAFALAVIAARTIDVRWSGRSGVGRAAGSEGGAPAGSGARTGMTEGGSERRADDQRSRLDVEGRADD